MSENQTLYKKNFKEFYMPMLIQFFIGGVMNSADKLIAILFIGPNALVATAISAPLLILASSLSVMFVSGVGSYLGVMQGRGKTQESNQVMTFILILVSIIALIIGLIFFIWNQPLASLLGAKEEFIPMTENYIKYISFYIFSMIIFGILQSCMMNDQAPKFVAWIKSTMTALNVIFNLIFVIGYDMGVKGLAIATAISSLFALLMGFYYMIFKAKVVRFARPKANFRSLFNIMYNGSSDFLTFFNVGISIVTINYAFVHFLPAYYFQGYSIAITFTIFIRFAFMASSNGMQPVISKLFGEGRFDDVKGQIRFNLKRSIIYAVIIYAMIFPFLMVMMPYFTPDKNIADITYRVYLGLGFTFLLSFMGIQFPAFYTAMGRPLESLVISTLRSLILVPLFVFFGIMFFKLNGLFIAYASADILLAIGIYLYWKRNDISKLKSVV